MGQDAKIERIDRRESDVPPGKMHELLELYKQLTEDQKTSLFAFASDLAQHIPLHVPEQD